VISQLKAKKMIRDENLEVDEGELRDGNRMWIRLYLSSSSFLLGHEVWFDWKSIDSKDQCL
jgi:hypothetical protein